MILNPARKQAEPSIKKSVALALDIETDGINFTRRRILMLQIACDDGSIFIWDIRKGWPTWLNPYLEKKLIIGHNLLFDGTFIQWHTGVRFRKIHDTKLNEQIILGIALGKGDDDRFLKLTEEETYMYSSALKFTLIRYGLPHKGSIDVTEFFTLGTKPFSNKMLSYGAGDVAPLHELMRMQLEKLEEMGLMNVSNLENEVLQVYIQMRINGIRFDTDRWIKIANDYTKEYEKRLNNLKRKAPEVTNWNSHVQVKKFFAEKRGIIIESFTDLKRIFSKHTMLGMDELLDDFIEMRQFYQVSHTFGTSWLTKKVSKYEMEEPTVDDDGRVHCDFNQIISTGRSSCSSPNLQQMPGYTSTKLGGGQHRSAFIPSKGHKFVDADFGGQEFALMMYVAQELEWLEHIRRGHDVHTIMAKQTQGQSWIDGTKKGGCSFEKTMKQCDCPVHKQLRVYSKGITFGIPYGKGPKSMAEDLAIPEADAWRIYRAVLKQIPRLKRWIDDRGRRAIREKAAYSLPPYNRYRNLAFEDKDWRRRNQGVNTPFQGSGGDMIKQAMVFLQREIDKGAPGKILLQIHDQLITEWPDAWVKRGSKILQDCMERAGAMITGGERLIKAKPQVTEQWTK